MEFIFVLADGNLFLNQRFINYSEFGIIIIVLRLLTVSLVYWQEELQDVTLWVAIDLTVSQLCAFLPS